MMRFYKCRFDFDDNCVEAILSDGSRLSIEYIAVESELAETWLDRRELDFLIYNEPSFWSAYPRSETSLIPAIFRICVFYQSPK